MKEDALMKTIFVIGAGPGLGNGVAKKFADNDFQVVLMARNSDHLKEYQQEFQKAGVDVKTQTVDASDSQSIHDAFQSAVSENGEPDVIFYNVGITSPVGDQPTGQQLMDHYQTDVVGAYNTIIEATNDQNFMKQPRSILITGGGLAFHPMAQYLPLSIDKAALRTMVLALHPALAKQGIFLGIVNVVGGIGGSPKYMPDKIANQFWQMYQDQTPTEITY